MFDRVFVYFYNGCFWHIHFHPSTSRNSYVNTLLFRDLVCYITVILHASFWKCKLFDQSHVTCTFMEWKFFLLTYSCSLLGGAWMRTCVPSMQPTTLGNPAIRRNFAFVRSACCCVGSRTHSCIRATSAFVTRWIVLDAVDWSIPMVSATKFWKHPVAYIRSATKTCKVAGKEPCRVSGYSKSSRSSSTISRMSWRRNLNLSYNSTSSYVSSGFILSLNNRFLLKFLLFRLRHTTTAAIFLHRLRVTPPS